MEEIKWLPDTDVLSQIGKKVREWRLEMDFSQKQLADKAQISPATIQQLEYGNNPTVKNLLRVLRVLDRLDFFALFFEQKQISPIEYAERMNKKTRRRATKKSGNNDKNADNTPVW